MTLPRKCLGRSTIESERVPPFLLHQVRILENCVLQTLAPYDLTAILHVNPKRRGRAHRAPFGFCLSGWQQPDAAVIPCTVHHPSHPLVYLSLNSESGPGLWPLNLARSWVPQVRRVVGVPTDRSSSVG